MVNLVWANTHISEYVMPRNTCLMVTSSVATEGFANTKRRSKAPKLNDETS